LEDQDDPKVIGKRLLGDRDCWAPHGTMLGDVGSLHPSEAPVFEASRMHDQTAINTEASRDC
jgi:hypothetical protein